MMKRNPKKRMPMILLKAILAQLIHGMYMGSVQDVIWIVFTSGIVPLENVQYVEWNVAIINGTEPLVNAEYVVWPVSIARAGVTIFLINIFAQYAKWFATIISIRKKPLENVQYVEGNVHMKQGQKKSKEQWKAEKQIRIWCVWPVEKLRNLLA